MLHNTALMPPRLIFALALSLTLHGSLFLPGLLKRVSEAPPRPVLQVLLRLPPKLEQAPFEPLLKNTIDSEETPPIEEPPPKTPQSMPKSTLKRDIQIAQKKLSQTQFYPPEAIARDIEGEVRLILKLSADGTVDRVSIAASSGYPILDNAAIKAAYAMGKLTGATSRELILPVIFRLE